MPISTHQNTVAGYPFRRLLNMETNTRWRCNSDIVILTPTFQILVTNLHPPPPDRNEREVVLGFRNSVSIPSDSDFPSTEPPRRSQSPSIKSPEPQYPTKEARTYSNTTLLILLFTANWCFIIASSPICLYSFPLTSFLLRHQVYSRFINTYRVKDGVGKISIDLDVDRH